jgi:hypothetical protein
MQVPRHHNIPVQYSSGFKGSDFIMATTQPLKSDKQRIIPSRIHGAHSMPKPFTSMAKVETLKAPPMRGTNIVRPEQVREYERPQAAPIDFEQAAMLAALKGVRPSFAPVAR